MSGGSLGRGVWGAGANPSALTEMDVAAGVLLDEDLRWRPFLDPADDPRAALEAAALDCLVRPPCVVAFSGGRDSSALLAVFLAVARREGLADPIAVTARWDGDEMSEEAGWQDEVARALDVRRWEIIRPEDDFDLLGPLATQALLEHGLLWPAPSYALLPLIRFASGGVFVSGEGGDEVLGLWPHARVWSHLRRRRRPPLRSLLGLGLGLAPAPVRRMPRFQRETPYQGWLRPDALAEYGRVLGAEQARDPFWWDRFVETAGRHRSLTVALATIGRLCAGEGADFRAPLAAPAFVAAVGRRGGRLGLGDRTEAMGRLFGDLLPEAVLGRSTKATFGGVFWGPRSRRFALEWDGRGVDGDLVIDERLRSAWQAPLPVYGSALPLHAAWLGSRPPSPEGRPVRTP